MGGALSDTSWMPPAPEPKQRPATSASVASPEPAASLEPAESEITPEDVSLAIDAVIAADDLMGAIRLVRDVAKLAVIEQLIAKTRLKEHFKARFSVADFDRAIRAELAPADAAGSRDNVRVEEQAASGQAHAAAGPPIIFVGGRELREEAEDCLTSLRAANDPPGLFIQSGRMFEIVRNEKARQVGREVTDAALRGRLTRIADFRRCTAKGVVVPCFPPREVVEDLLSLPPGVLGFPALDGIVNTPLIRDDGSILVDPGYDLQSKLFYSPEPGFRLPCIAEHPSTDHIEIAKALLDEMVEGFPFDGPSSKANYIGAILTPVLRPVIAGPTPMAAITAPAAGSGKSLLAEIVSIIATGEPAEMYSMPKDEEEMRKTLTTILASMAQVCVFDNVSRRMDSPDLAKALTESTHADRVFRTHQAMVLPVRCAWMVTGNNLRVGGDLHRRCYWIRLDAKTSRPELRNEFRIADLKTWVGAHRSMLLASLFTLARAWFAAGRPRPRLTPLGSFESWSLTIAGILEYVGIPGFLGNASEMREEADAEAGEWERFLQVLQETFGERAFSVFDLYKKLIEKTSNGFGGGMEPSCEADQLRRALPGYLSEVVDRNGFFQRRTGRLFAEHCERRFGESQIYIRREGITHHAQMWGIRGGELRGVVGELKTC